MVEDSFENSGLRAALLAATVTAITVLSCLAGSGCLGVSGAIAALFVAGSDDGGTSPAPDAASVPAFTLQGPFAPLGAIPADVAIGDLIPDDDSESGPEIAVISRSSREVLIVGVDASGRPFEAARVALSADASLTHRIATIDLPGPSDAFVVATTGTLESIQWDPERGEPRSHVEAELDLDPEQRDIAVGDFNGDTVPDVAVSSRFLLSIDAYLGELVDGQLRLHRWQVIPAESPRALAAANFDADCAGISDLAVLVKGPTSPPTIVLLLCDGSSFHEQSRLSEPDLTVDAGARLIASDDSNFTAVPEDELCGCDDPRSCPRPCDDVDHSDIDVFPDLLAIRQRNVVRVIVHRDRDAENRPKLRLHNRPTGPSGRRIIATDLIRLPRDAATLEDAGQSCVPRHVQDIVALDVLLDEVQFGITEIRPQDEPGLEKDHEVSYAVAGRPQALDVGDLDGDARDDVAIVTFDPEHLVVLMQRSPGESDESAPFRYPQGLVFGEDLPRAPSLSLVALGDHRSSRFVASARENLNGDAEIIVHFLDELGNARPEVESYRLPPASVPRNVSHLAVTDIDGDGLDDIVVSITSGGFYSLRQNDSGEPGFTWARSDDGVSDEIFDFATWPTTPSFLDPAAIRVRDFVAVDLDGNGLGDLVVPLSRSFTGDDWLGVVLNPAARAPILDVTFHVALDDPRQASIANLNGDTAPDLVIAVEGSKMGQDDVPETVDKVLLLFGDPERPGRFFGLGDEAPPDLQPLILDGFEGRDHATEAAAADGSLDDPSKVARFLAVSADTKCAIYVNENSGPGRPIFTRPPVVIYSGSDPENIIVAELCHDSADKPELIVADEDLGTILVFQDDDDDDWTTWRDPVSLPFEGRPDGIALATAEDGQHLLVVGTKLAHLEVYAMTPPDCEFVLKPRIEVDFARAVGGSGTLSALRLDDGSCVLSAAVEDRDASTDESAVDLLHVASGGRLLDGSARPARVLYGGGPSSPQIDSSLLARFSQERLDLVVRDARDGAHYLQPDVLALLSEPAGTADASIVPGTEDGDFVTCSRAGLRDGDRLVVATTREVRVGDPASAGAWQTLWRAPVGALIRDVATGWIGPRTGDLSNLRVAVTLAEDGTTLVIHGARLGAGGDSSLLCWSDLDRDSRDDLIRLDQNSVEVLLGGDGKSVRTELISLRDPRDILGWDANRDGFPDLAIGTASGQVIVVAGNGRGSFVEERRFELYAGRGFEALATIDLDDDGREELLVANSVPGLSIVTSVVTSSQRR